MKINYVTIASDKLGSFRYNIKTPGMELSKMGHEVTISSEPLQGKDAYVFHKHLRHEDIFFMNVAKRSNPKSKTYYIVCDYHLDNKYRNHYQTMINNCDRLVVCTEAMKTLLKNETGKDSTVIKDPWGIEFNEHKPSFKKKEVYNLLWFGSKTNLDGLLNVVKDIPENYHLTVVTDHESGIFDVGGIRAKIISYSTEKLKEQLELCDVVLLPNDPKDKKKNVKTHNRLVDAIRSGKVAIASPIDSYKELSRFSWVGDISEGFNWLSNQDSTYINYNLSDGQEYIRKNFAPSVIGKRWEQLFKGEL